MLNSHTEYYIRARQLETIIGRAQAALDRALKQQKRELAELRARMASLERERDRE